MANTKNKEEVKCETVYLIVSDLDKRPLQEIDYLKVLDWHYTSVICG